MNFFNHLFDVVDNNYYGVSGLNPELNCIYVYDAFLKYDKGMLVVTNSLYEANILFSKILNYTDRVLFFPMDDFITSEAIAVSPEFKSERLHTLNQLSKDNRYIVVTNLMGVLRYLPTVDVWKKHVVHLKKGMSVERDRLVQVFFDIGYERETVVSETGKLGVRGYVLDIFPIDFDRPIRIEFWGDEIDSIKYFDIDSQISSEIVDEVDIYPYTEFLLDKECNVEVKSQKYLKFYSDKIGSLWDFVGGYVCFYYDYNQIEEGYRVLRETIFNYDKDNRNTSGIQTNYMYDLKDIHFENEIFLMNLDNILMNIQLNEEKKYVSGVIDHYNGNFNLLKKDLEKYLSQHKTIILCVDSEHSRERMDKYFEQMDIVNSDENSIVLGRINILVKNIDSGFIFGDYVVISANDMFRSNEVKKKYKNKFKLGTKISNVSNINKGDYIVHEAHGIGIYDELCTIVKNGYKKDYIKLIYDGGDVLYIPVEKIDRISKFSGKEGISVRLDSLGSDKWQKRKARVRSRLEDIAANLIKVSAEREAKKGFAFSPDDESQILFDHGFQFEETPDQVKAISAIKYEMEKPIPMDMLLCGDVGYGKTEVAFRAMFKAVNDGKQVAYLCPTTILSSQQYKNALKRFEDFPVSIALLNRFVDRTKQKKIIEDLKNGKIDILFGTHRILSSDIIFRDLGLLVVDEEQRFGVTHKEKIKQYKSNIDVLTLSATPIPRTLQMSMTGIRSLALIETPPLQRLPIQTYVLGENDNVIKDALYKELSRNGQAFVLYNHVDDIERKMVELNQLVPEARMDFAHGRMTKSELENKMQKFIDYQFDVLVCTTIIETGIDIPNVNTLIIMDADHFGLSQLYQIRGRIGRSDKIGYAYLMYDNHKELNEIAIKRLNTIKEFTELGSGFKIAMRDLSIRGAGDILGSEQSGFIDTIGIELYLKMLKDAVDKIKGEYVEEEEDLNLDNHSLIDVDTHIDDNYVKDDDLKIEIHRKINEVNSMEKLNEVKAELEDRFGKISYEMEVYMYEEWFEKLANKLEIKKVKQTKTMVDLELSEKISGKIQGEELFMMSYAVSPHFKLSFRDNKIHIILEIVNLEKHFLLYIIELLSKLIDTLGLND